MAIFNPFTAGVSVGGTAVALAASPTVIGGELKIVAAKGNSGTIYIGFSNAVTASTAVATDGYELAASAVLNVPLATIPGGDVANIWAIASASSQKVFLFAY